MNLATQRYWGATPANLTVTRAGTNATDLTYDQTGRTSYNSFSANAARIVADGRGLLVEESRTQYLGVTDTPTTQTTSSLGAGSYTLWVIGSGSAAVSAGTATITGAGSATAGTPLTFTVTAGGTVVVTKTGALTFFQLENGAFATSYIPNAGAAGSTSVRAADVVYLTSTALTSWYNSAGGFIYVEASMDLAGATGLQYVLCEFGTNVANNNAFIQMGSVFGSTDLNFLINDGAVSQCAISTAGITANTKRAARFVANDFSFVQNGTVIGTDASGTIPTIAQFNIGSRPAFGNVGQANAFIKRVAYAPPGAVWSSATMQALTA